MLQELDDRAKNFSTFDDGSKKEELIIPPEIYINIGTLRLEVGKTHDALDSF